MKPKLKQKGIGVADISFTPLHCHFYAGSAVVLWGAANVVLRATTAYFYAPHLNALRYLFAAMVLLAIIIIGKIPLPDLKDLPLVAFAGIMGFGLHTITLAVAVKTIPATTASLTVATTPVWTALVAYIIFSEHIHPLGWAAIGINVAGIFMLNASGGGKLSINIGLLWAFLSALAMCFYNIAQRRLSMRYSALQTTAYEIIFSVIFQSVFLPGAVSNLRNAPISVLGAVVFLGVGSSLAGFLLWSKALGDACLSSEVVNWMFITPFFTTIFSFIFLGEIPDPLTILGGITIIGGLVLFRVAARQYRSV